MGNAGANVLDGGAGDDVLDGRDGGSLVDQLLCGIGADSYTADPADAPTACETLVP